MTDNIKSTLRKVVMAGIGAAAVAAEAGCALVKRYYEKGDAFVRDSQSAPNNTERLKHHPGDEETDVDTSAPEGKGEANEQNR